MSNLITLAIDGISVQVERGTTILEAAQAAGIKIPTLCYLKDTNDIGMCRMCVVEVEGMDNLVASCNTPAAEGMVVTTNSQRVKDTRVINFKLLIAEHDFDGTNDCLSCVSNNNCELQTLRWELEVYDNPFKRNVPRKPVRESNPFLLFNPNLCIKCQRCVGACNNKAHNHTLQTGKRGLRTTIQAPFGDGWDFTACESCGMCAQACPTGAITEKRGFEYQENEIKKTLTTCPHCGVGCQLYLITKNDKIVDVRAADGPSNKQMLCIKGRSASFDFVHSKERLTTPLVKNPATGEFMEATWDEALDLVAQRFTVLKNRYGGNALAAFACSRSTNEDVYLLQKMARTVFQTNNVDNCARV